MANCATCKHSEPYFDPKDGIDKMICLSPQRESMATTLGEHDCSAWKYKPGTDDWDEKRVDVIGSNGNLGLHYKDEE